MVSFGRLLLKFLEKAEKGEETAYQQDIKKRVRNLLDFPHELVLNHGHFSQGALRMFLPMASSLMLQCCVCW